MRVRLFITLLTSCFGLSLIAFFLVLLFLSAFAPEAWHVDEWLIICGIGAVALAYLGAVVIRRQ